jgi:hypothetical protein
METSGQIPQFSAQNQARRRAFSAPGIAPELPPKTPLRQNAEAQKSAEKKNTLLLPRAPAYNQIKNRKGRSKP